MWPPASFGKGSYLQDGGTYMCACIIMYTMHMDACIYRDIISKIAWMQHAWSMESSDFEPLPAHVCWFLEDCAWIRSIAIYTKTAPQPTTPVNTRHTATTQLPDPLTERDLLQFARQRRSRPHPSTPVNRRQRNHQTP